MAGPIVGIISDTVHVGYASIPAPNGHAKETVSGISSGIFPPHMSLLGPTNDVLGKHHEATKAVSGIVSGVFPKHMPLLGPTNEVLGKLHEATKAARETCAGHHATTIKVGANFPHVRTLSWAPKKGTNADLLNHGKFSQNEHNGMDAIGARSLKGVSGENGSALTNSNPASGGHPRSFLGLGKSLIPPGKQDEQVRKGDLQGSGSAGNGYDHCNSSSPAVINYEMTNDPPIKSWKSLVSTPVKTGGPLQFYMPHCTDGKIIAKPPVEAVNEGIDMWKGCLVGQFLDKRLPFPVVRSLVNRLWGKREMPDISTTESGLFFFRFWDPEARDWVMNAGPWHLAGRPFILRAWKPGMDMLNIQLSSIPIWVRFYNIPLEYWTSTCLGHIASTVGIPLHLDPLTENQTKLSFARVCIEVGVDCEFPKSVLLDRGNGSYSTIRIEYHWAPQCCSECKLFGHNLVHCQAKKNPSSSMISINHGNLKSKAVIGKVIDDAGEGLEIAAEYTTLVAIPTVPHAATDSTFLVPTPTVAHAEAGIRLDVEDINTAIEVDVPPKLHGNTFDFMCILCWVLPLWK